VSGVRSHTCGLATNGVAWCWGWTTDDQGIYWDVQFGPTPVTGPTFRKLSGGNGGFDGHEGRSCGLAIQGGGYCRDPAFGDPWPIEEGPGRGYRW